MTTVLKLTKSQLVASLEAQCGTLSKPSKMPCYSWSLPAEKCKVGSRLHEVLGSTCEKCYALKNFYLMPSTKKAMDRRFEALQDLETWKRAIAELIRLKEKSGYFRWHDSGDIQSVQHLLAIFWIARQLPDIQFWLPTREYKMVQEVLEMESRPSNLIIRLSAHMVDFPPPEKLARRLGVETSTVSSNGGNCPAPKQDNKCLECRACWKNGNVEYHKH